MRLFTQLFASQIGVALVAIAAVVGGCSGATDPADQPLPYASHVERFEAGEGAGWGQHYLPDVVLGPPAGAKTEASAAAEDAILSLGVGGEVVVGFDGRIADGPGPDFVVFENPFWIRDDPSKVWAELAEVSVSSDGQTWQTFGCAVEPVEAGRWPGCAGWTPTKVYDPRALVPIDPTRTGGDGFDLADVGVDSARYVRVRDLADSTNSAANNAGFDLDAVGVVHWLK